MDIIRKISQESIEELLSRIDKFERKIINAANKKHTLFKHKWLNSEELCLLLNCNKRTLVSLRHQRKIPYTYFEKGGKCYYNAEEVEAILLKNRIIADKELLKK